MCYFWLITQSENCAAFYFLRSFHHFYCFCDSTVLNVDDKGANPAWWVVRSVLVWSARRSWPWELVRRSLAAPRWKWTVSQRGSVPWCTGRLWTVPNSWLTCLSTWNSERAVHWQLDRDDQCQSGRVCRRLAAGTASALQHHYQLTVQNVFFFWQRW